MRRWAWLLLCWYGCASEEGGCGSDYPYPRELPAAAPTPQALRGRVTQSGLDAAMRGVSAVLEAACEGGTAGCQLDPAGEAVEFYLGTPSNPVNFSSSGFTGSLRAGGAYAADEEAEGGLFWDGDLNNRPYCDDTGGTVCQQILSRGTGTTGNGVCRTSGGSCNDEDSDYCCGNVATHLCDHDYAITTCQAARSTLGLKLDSLEGNLNLSLVQDSDGGGLRITLGCTAADFDDCDDASKYVVGTLDLTAVGSLAGTDIACLYQDDPARNAAFEIQSMKFVVKPRVAHAADGRPYLVLDEAEVNVERFEFNLYNGIADGPAYDNPACYDEGWSILGESGNNFSDCEDFCPAAPTFLDSILSGVLGETLANTVAQTLIEQLGNRALDAEGPLDLSPLFPNVPPQISQVDYLVAASENSPHVTGPTQAGLGMNVDLDTGFYGPHHPCVPVVAAPAWMPLSAPDPGTTVMAPDPVTGELESEAFDFAVIATDVAFDRAAWAMYDGGSLCLAFPAEQVAELSQGKFIPTVGVVALLAPGIADLAPQNAPVDLMLSPKGPPTVDFGDGSGSGDTRNSHVKLAWKDLQIDLYPYDSEARMRALAIGFDLNINITLAATPHGAVQLVIDKLELANAHEAYNEMGLAFDAEGVGDLISAFLPSILSGDAIDVPLSSDALGFPLVPKFRAVELLGFEGRHLGLFFKLCPGPDIADAGNALCYEEGGNSAESALGVSAVGEPDGEGGTRVAGALRLIAHSDSSDLELLVRADGLGPPFAYTADEDGRYTVTHPALHWIGTHRLEVTGRSTSKPGLWTKPVTIDVNMVEPLPHQPASAPVEEPPALGVQAPETVEGCAAVQPALGGLVLVLWAARRRRYSRFTTEARRHGG